MMLKIRTSLLALTILWLPLCAQNELPSVWTLEDCVAYALEKNINVRQAQMQLNIADNNLQTAQFDYLPNLNFSSNYFWNFGLNIDPVTNQISQQNRQTANFNLSSNWLIYNGGRKYNSISQNKFNAKAAQLDYQQARNDISLNVASAYLRILLNQEIAAVATEQLRISTLQVNRTAKLVEAGSLAKGELLQLEAQLARDRQNSIATENAVAISKLQLANLLQLENPDEFNVGSPQLSLPNPSILSRSPQSVYYAALETQPNIKAAEVRTLASEEAVDVAQGGYLPTLSMIAQIGSNYSDQIPNVTGSTSQLLPIGQVASTGDLVTTLQPQTIPQIDGVKPFNSQFTDNLNEVVGLNLQIPIFNRLSVKNAVQNAKINADLARLNFESEKNILRQTIYQAHADAKAAYLQYQAAEKAVLANKEAFDYAQKRFEVGAINQVDFEAAKNNLASAQSQFVQGKYDYIFRIKILEFYLTNAVKL